MRLSFSKSANSVSLYVIKSTYENKIKGTKVVERLGTIAELSAKLGGQDPVEWARAYVAELNRKEKEGRAEVLVRLAPNEVLDKDQQQSFNGGYLFLQKLYHQLGIDDICAKISEKHKFSFDLDSILSRLIYSRILFPASKLATCELSKRYLEKPNFELQHIYRALEVIAKEDDFIQAELYRNSLKVSKRNTGILYYDCTNFFFEMEEADGLKQYGMSKEHRPNPIVQMGLFLDGDGVPLAFCLNSGNTNEQTTLKPLEKQIIKDFSLSKFIVCTDAGLASYENRKFNDLGNRAFVTTQSIKMLKGHLKDWSLDPTGWSICGESKFYDISKIDEEIHKETVFYKQRWINENGLSQKLIVSYSVKYRDYQRAIRLRQIERAQKAIENGRIERTNQNDYKRLISKTAVTPDGEVADKKIYVINTELIETEAIYDGFYGVCTNLEDDASEILKINKRRWEIEESFRIMKSEFKARPVHLSRDDRIKAHFATCFMSLMLFRMLEKRLGEKVTCPEIIRTLKGMEFLKVDKEGYVPTYTRTDLTDKLHEAFGFRTDYKINTTSAMKKIFKITKA
jgi:transposase